VALTLAGFLPIDPIKVGEILGQMVTRLGISGLYTTNRFCKFAADQTFRNSALSDHGDSPPGLLCYRYPPECPSKHLASYTPFPAAPFQRRHIADTERQCLRQIVNFNKGIARGVIHSAHNRGVASRLQRGDDG
jgi:hypothetical protein